jgi:DNA modification methylase
MPNHEIHLGDCLEVLRSIPSNSIHAIVTDPPMMGIVGDENQGIP